MTTEPDLLAARERAHAARADFQAALTQAADRFAPARLKEDAALAASQSIDGAKEALRQQVQRHPVILSVLAGAFALLVLWRPVKALTRAGRKSVQALRDHLGQGRNHHGG
ncbi:MAG TPA: hypothetical protein VL918_14590 [Sphingobium sp.]|nr:hypothetical protein [Sphingobium sp.]